MEIHCPQCKRPLANTDKTEKTSLLANNRFFPFCSERCKLIDIGAWIDGDYRIIEKDDWQYETE